MGVKYKMKRLSLILSAALIALTACGGGDAVQAPSATDTATETAEVIDAGYDYPAEGYGGYEFRFLNMDSQFNCYIRLDFEEQTGESLDDSVYLRNRKVEEKLGIKITELRYMDVSWSSGQIGLCNELINSVMAGDDHCDAAYLPVYFKPEVVTGGYLMDLRSIPELRLDQPYWDQVINDSLEYSGRLYTASGPLHLMTFDLSWVLLFNQRLMTDLGLEYPYKLVTDGKWTLDRFNEYVTASPDIAGESSFAYKADGVCRYGIAGHSDSPTGFIYSAGNVMTGYDAENRLTVTVGTEKLYSTIDKLIEIFDTKEGKVYYDNNEYLKIFRDGRAVFITCELKASLEEREMEDAFGLLPFPKYDERQENYQTTMNSIACLLTVPITQTDPARAGVILDALTYESMQTVLPMYYDVTLSQKGLRNNESIDMLDIIRNTRGVEFTDVFGITTGYSGEIKSMVTGGRNTAASATEKNLPKIEANLERVNSAFAAG